MSQGEEHDKVRGEIIKAAGEVFMRYGFIRTSMQDISKASGKGRSTLYHYFKNKEDILEAFMLEAFCEVQEGPKTKIKPEATFTVNMEAYYRAKLHILRRLLKQYHLLVEDARTDPSLFLDKVNLFFDKEVLTIKQIIMLAMDKKEIAALSQDDTEFLAVTLVTAFQSFEQGMVLYGKFDDFEDKLLWLSQILMKGLQ